MKTRAEHLAWCKQRALEYVDRGDLGQAFTSLASDLGKEPCTLDAQAVCARLGMGMLICGALNTPERMRDFINGFN